MIYELVKFSFKGLSHRKLRSWLTIIGIFIGISAVVGLISLAQGMQYAIAKEFEKLGTDKITITPGATLFGPGASGASKLTESDLKAIKRVKGVENAGGWIMLQYNVKFGDEKAIGYVIGWPLDKSLKFLEEAQSFEIMEGRDLRKGDRYKAVIGYEVAKGNLFSKEVNIRDKLIIKGKEFRVVGILKKIGSKIDDSTVVIPIDIARELFGLDSEYSMISVKVKENENPSEVAEEIKKELRRERGLKEGEEDFTVQTMEDIRRRFNSVLGMVSLVLIGIAAISLLVGGIGIMNTMYTAVLERTKDIGIMKAIGAKDRDILIIFLFESGFIGLVGGIIGCFLGILFALAITQFGLTMGFGFLEAKISMELILFAIIFSFVIGAISGILPAIRASKLQPVEALREL